MIKSPPDGYTLFLGHTGSISINPSLYANAGFDPRKDFTAIGLIASMPVALIAHPSFPAKTIGEAVALLKANPGKHNIGTSAVGTGGYHVGRAVQVGRPASMRRSCPTRARAA